MSAFINLWREFWGWAPVIVFAVGVAFTARAVIEDRAYRKAQQAWREAHKPLGDDVISMLSAWTDDDEQWLRDGDQRG